MISNDDFLKVEKLLGRKPRGLKEIVCYGPDEWPRVLRVSPIVDGVPFPSHYWLCCPILKKEIDRIESQGWIKKIEQDYLLKDEEFHQRVIRDHENYIKKRMEFLNSDGLIEMLDESMLESLKTRGVGGIQDFSRVRCLHMHYAHHLAEYNTIGKLLDELFGFDKL